MLYTLSDAVGLGTRTQMHRDRLSVKSSPSDTCQEDDVKSHEACLLFREVEDCNRIV